MPGVIEEVKDPQRYSIRSKQQQKNINPYPLPYHYLKQKQAMSMHSRNSGGSALFQQTHESRYLRIEREGVAKILKYLYNET